MKHWSQIPFISSPASSFLPWQLKQRFWFPSMTLLATNDNRPPTLLAMTSKPLIESKVHRCLKMLRSIRRVNEVSKARKLLINGHYKMLSHEHKTAVKITLLDTRIIILFIYLFYSRLKTKFLNRMEEGLPKFNLLLISPCMRSLNRSQ